MRGGGGSREDLVAVPPGADGGPMRPRRLREGDPIHSTVQSLNTDRSGSQCTAPQQMPYLEKPSATVWRCEIEV